jgi:hypothetical protein
VFQAAQRGVQLRQLATVSHRAPQLVGLTGTEAAERHGDCHRLLLEDRHAIGATQNRLEHGMRIMHGLSAATSLGIWMDETRLDRTGPDQRDLHDDVVEPLRLRLQDRLDLRAALDLERADRVAARDHVVRLRIIDRQAVHRQLFTGRLADRVECQVDRG